jgi:glucan endo-1,3-alpha-glucosidase
MRRRPEAMRVFFSIENPYGREISSPPPEGWGRFWCSNDWCESHYLRDLPGNSTSATDYADLNNMKTYVDGQDHSPWRIIAKYYISWWKNGKKPIITEDQVVFWYRVHQKNAECNQGSKTIRNSNPVEDAIFAWAAVTEE